MRKRIAVILILSTIFFALSALTVFACEGSRPMSMGGAFTGLADDANATYWNPAALGKAKQPELIYTGTLYDRNSYNYDDWFSIVFPLEKPNLGTIGFSIMNNTDKGTYSLQYYDIDINVEAEINTQWYTLSYGRQLSEIADGLCLGANIRYKTLEESLKAQATIGGITYTESATDSDDTIEIDMGIYYKKDKLSAGILFQNVNEPTFTLFGATAKYNVNIRPGIAYRVHDRLLLTTELYDATDKSNYQNLRIGAEAKITDNINLRLGGYDITGTDKTGRAVTCGFGLNFDGDKFNFDNKDATFSIDYGVLYWYESDVDIKDKFTHLLSSSVKF